MTILSVNSDREWNYLKGAELVQKLACPLAIAAPTRTRTRCRKTDAQAFISATTGQQPSDGRKIRNPRERMVARLRSTTEFATGGKGSEARGTSSRFRARSSKPRYGDHALPISANQTISHPYIVARMTELLRIDKESRVGSWRRIGYQNACVQESRSGFAMERIGFSS